MRYFDFRLYFFQNGREAFRKIPLWLHMTFDLVCVCMHVISKLNDNKMSHFIGISIRGSTALFFFVTDSSFSSQPCTASRRQPSPTQILHQVVDGNVSSQTHTISSIQRLPEPTLFRMTSCIGAIIPLLETE